MPGLTIPPNGRIPFRPLDYENAQMAVPKEIILDYDNGIVWMSDKDGKLKCITTAIVREVINNIISNPNDFDFAHNIIIWYKGNEYRLDDLIRYMNNVLDHIKELLKYKVDTEVDEDGNEIELAFLQTIDNIFSEIEKLKQVDKDYGNRIKQLEDLKTTTYTIDVTVPSSGWVTVVDKKDYYITINVSNIKETDEAYVHLIKSTNYNTMILESTQFGNVYRIVSGNGKITVYSRSVPTVPFKLRMHVPRILQSGLPASGPV